MKAGKVINIKGWSPKQIDLTPLQNFINKVPENNDVPPYEAYKLAVEGARVLDYLAEVKSKVELFYLRARAEYRQEFELKSIEYNEKSVADGERHAHQDGKVSKLREQRDYAQAYHALIDEKIRSVERLHYIFKQKHQVSEREEGRASYGE